MRKVVFLALLAAALPAITALAETSADEQMAHRIGGQLKTSGQLHHYQIGVKFHDGVACLEGKVTSQQQRAAAVRLAQHVKGVSRVECKLEIANDLQADDDSSNDHSRNQLAAALERASQDDSQGEPSNVKRVSYQGQREPASMPNQQQRQQQEMMTSSNNTRMSSQRMQRNNMPLPQGQMPGMMPVRQASATGVYQAGGSCPSCNGGGPMGPSMGGPGMGGAPEGFVPQGGGRGPSYDNPSMPGYAWPSYASYPNYAALSYPQQYSPTAWPYIGPFYPYPQVPLAWRKVSLEWDDGWWFLDFSSHNSSH